MGKKAYEKEVTKEVDEKNIVETNWKDLLLVLGEILDEARQAKKDTLSAAATKMEMGENEATIKANLHNIEKGNVFLPWKRIIDFSDYTNLNPALVLIILGAAKAFKDLPKSEDRDRLYSHLKDLLNLPAGKKITDLLKRTAERETEARLYRERLQEPPSLKFWKSLWEGLPYVPSQIAPSYGEYKEYKELVQINLNSEVDYLRVILQVKPATGAEIVLDQHLKKFDDRFPVYIDGSKAVHTDDLAKYVNKAIFQEEYQLQHLSLDWPLLRNRLAFIIYNLPTNTQQLGKIVQLISQLVEEIPNGHYVCLVDSNTAVGGSPLTTLVSGSQFVTYTNVPYSEFAALKEYTDLLEENGVRLQEERHDQWLCLAIRQPFWFALIGRLSKERKRVPKKWETVRAGAFVLTKGEYKPNVTRWGLYQYIELGDTNKGSYDPDTRVSIGQLAANAARSLTSGDDPFGLDPDLLNSHNHLWITGLLDYTLENKVKFAVNWVHGYFAALHFLKEIRSSASPMSAFREIMVELTDAISSGDTHRALVTEVLSALLAEVESKDGELLDNIKTEASTSKDQSGAFYILKKILRSDYSPENEAPKIEVKESKYKYRPDADGLNILAEDQGPAENLQILPSLLQRSNRLDFPVYITKAPYKLVTEAVLKAIDHQKDNSEPPDYDVIICPHYSLAHRMAEKRGAVIWEAEELEGVKELGLLSRLCCLYKRKWIGVPFQFPTKYLCYRSDLIDRPPSSLSEIVKLKDELKDKLKGFSSRGGLTSILGLQGKKSDPSLYYEWLAFVIALGGGDVLWDETLPDGEVILDSEATVEATLQFLNLFADKELVHKNSLVWDWDTVVTAMVSGEIALCFPFSDTVYKLNQRRYAETQKRELDLGYAPIRLADGNLPTHTARKIYGFDHLPLHIFTGHVAVAINSNEKMRQRLRTFMRWLIAQPTQENLVNFVYQTPYSDTLLNREEFQDATTETPRALSTGGTSPRALSTGAIVQQYAYLPLPARFKHEYDTPQSIQNDGSHGRPPLPEYQNIVLESISRLLHEYDTYSGEFVRKELSETAARLRRQRDVIFYDDSPR